MSNKEQAHNIEIEAVFDKDLAGKKVDANNNINNNQKQHNITEILSFYLTTNAAFVEAMADKYYSSKLFVPSIPTITLGINYTIVNLLFKKMEGKSNIQATSESGLEFVFSFLGGKAGKFVGKKGSVFTTRLTSAVIGRTLGGIVGSSVPFVGTIAGSIIGGWIAGKVEKMIFGDQEQNTKSKITNADVDKISNSYIQKLQKIQEYCNNNQLIEMRMLTEKEVEKLCYEASNPHKSYESTLSLCFNFKNYLQTSKKQRDSNAKDSAINQSTKSPNPTNQAKSQPTSTNITNPLHILLYLEDAITPLNDIKIKLTPNHIKDSTKPQDSIQEQISKNGKVTFNIPSNANTFDLEIIDDRFYPKSKSNIQRVTNSYRKENNTIKLYLLAKIWLYFNGEQIFIMQRNKIIESFRAYSGNRLNLAQKQNLIKERGYTKFVSCVDSKNANDTMYFCLDKHWQTQKDKGSMPEGNYYVDINDIRDRWTIFTENKFGKNTRIYGY